VIDDVKELKENYPDSALVLDVNDDKLPDVSHLSYKKVYLCMIWKWDPIFWSELVWSVILKLFNFLFAQYFNLVVILVMS